MHDLVIDNARIVDGTGGPSRHGTLAVRDGRIVDVAGVRGQLARERLNADGRVVAPGFIDPHTHSIIPTSTSSMRASRPTTTGSRSIAPRIRSVCSASARRPCDRSTTASATSSESRRSGCAAS